MPSDGLIHARHEAEGRGLTVCILLPFSGSGDTGSADCSSSETCRSTVQEAAQHSAGSVSPR